MKKMKNVIIVFLALTMIISSYIPVYGEDADWIQQAFDAAKDFLNEDISNTDITVGGSSNDENSTDENNTVGIVSKMLLTFKMIVKAINTILLAVLAGLSAISLAITGIRFIMSKSASPAQIEVAKNNLHTVFKGMFFGFGAFLIWNIAMSIVNIIISGMGSG